MKDKFYHLILHYIHNNKVLIILKVKKFQLFIIQVTSNIHNKNFNYINHKINKIHLMHYNLLKRRNLI